MKLIDGEMWFSPTDLSQFYKSPFGSWMDHYCILNPDKKFDFQEDSTMKLLAQRGDEHEVRFLKKLKSQYSDLIEINKNQSFSQAIADTKKALSSGASIIFQGALSKDKARGFTDFLVRVEKPSKLGAFSYEVWDTKLARTPKPEYMIQLSCYSEMLADIQGNTPENFSIVLGDNSKVDFRTNDFSAFYRRFKNNFIKFHKNFDSKKRPLPQAWESLGNWQELGDEILKEMDHLSLVAGISSLQIRKMEKNGITKVTDLVKAKASQKPDGMQEATFERLQRQATLQKRTEQAGKTEFELRKMDIDQPYGLQKLPSQHAQDVYFDMEGFPLAENGLEYLFGAIHLEKEKTKFIDWWALDKEQEKVAFENWIDWVFKRWKKNPEMHIYHYAAYEVTAMKKLMGQHLTREYEVDELLRNGVFIDLYQVVREGLIVGEPSYSIKKLEGLYDFKRQGDVKNAGDSVVQFANWLEMQDGNDWKTSVTLKEIRDYNEEDCVSTLLLTQWLRKVQKENKIEYQTSADEEIKETPKHEAEILSSILLTTLPTDPAASEVQNILAAAMGYHRREAKPQWWSFFERQNALPEDLINDLDCLAMCKVKNKKNGTVSISFDPDQETKIEEGSDACLHHDTKIRATVESIDFVKGEAQLTISRAETLPKEITLIPNGPISTKAIEDALFQISVEWNKKKSTSSLKPTLKDLLTRANPRFTDNRTQVFSGLSSSEKFLEEVSAACRNLDKSVLAIQGPPGTGKTFTASHLISDLLSKGKKVAITSNSHKAVNHLMEKVHEVLVVNKNRDQFSFYKIRNEKEEDFCKSTKTLPAKSASDFWKTKKPFDLVGGTSWFFSSPNSESQFDYLFIEEAGQFSLANAIAVQRCAANLVLLGDQMQLEQPVQGTHPEEISESVLGYYLKGYAAVPPEKGIFLGETRRMHPNVCKYISEMIYEGKLGSHASTNKNMIKDFNKKSALQESGIVFIPVEHDGNSQGSDEEVAIILETIKELKSASVHGDKKPAKFDISDCLFVAPYNLQVGKIRKALGLEAKVGSVDLFQGQEAPVVFLSMCSSDGEASPRGLDFLLNKNRLNVAISRAKSLAIVVGSTRLAETRATTIRTMALLNLFCGLLEASSGEKTK